MSMRRAFTLAEVLLAAGLLSILVGIAVWLSGFGALATGRLTPRLGLQQTGRRAVARLLRELQEGMEVLQPRPGSTMAYALVRDKYRIDELYGFLFVNPVVEGSRRLHLICDHLIGNSQPHAVASAVVEMLRTR